MSQSSTWITTDAPVRDEVVRAITSASNDALILRLLFTVHHLSRWITPIHDRNLLERSRYRDQPSVRDLVVEMREHEQFIYPRFFVIANEQDPDLDEIPPYEPTAYVDNATRSWSTVELLGGFRRLRQSTVSLLRQMPNGAWERKGYSRKYANVTMRELAEQLVEHDYRFLRTMDQVLWDTGARDGIAEIRTAPLDDLIALVPTNAKF